MDVARRSVRVTLAEGLHMRPCSLLQSAAADFDGTVRLNCGDRSADVKSIFDLLSLGMESGEEGELVVEGPGAEAMIVSLSQMFETDFGD